MAHTAGPWTIHPTGAQIVGGADGMTSVCNTFGSKWHETAMRAQKREDFERCAELAEEHAANARLIAAAPDLLAVVRLFVESRPGPQYQRWVHPREVDRLARAALAKVEG